MPRLTGPDASVAGAPGRSLFELREKAARLAELNALLDMDRKENELVDGEPVEEAEVPARKERDLAR